MNCTCVKKYYLKCDVDVRLALCANGLNALHDTHYMIFVMGELVFP